MNFHKSDLPKWQCGYSGLSVTLLVTSFRITCENPFPSQQPQTHYKENTCFLNFTLKVNENVVTYRETSYLVFNKLEQTKGKIPIPQLQCIDDSSDDFCTNSTVNQANCTNQYYEHAIYFWPKWTCRLIGLTPDLLIKENNVSCESPDDKSQEIYQEYYKKETCSLKYSLKLNAPKDDKKSDDKSPKKDSADHPNSNSAEIYILVAFFLFSVCYFMYNWFHLF